MRISLLAVLVLMTVALRAGAAESYVGLSGRYEQSDNITHSESGGEDEQIFAPRLDATVISKGGRLQGAGTFYVERADYLDDTFDDETLYNLVTSWDAELLENRLTWILDDVAVRQVLDARDTDTAENRTDQNYLITGPRINFGSGTRSQSYIAALYSNYWYGEDTGVDSERVTGRSGFTHRLTQITSMGGRAEWTRADFTEDGGADFERDEVVAQLSRRLARSNWLLELGYNRIRPEDPMTGEEEEFAGPMGSFHWRQEWRPRLATRLNVGSRLSDAGQEAVDEALEGGVDLDETINTDIFRAHDVGLLTEWEGAIWSFQVGARAERYNYESEPLDRRASIVELGLNRLFSPQTSMSFYAEGGRREYTEIERRDNDIEGSLRLNRIFSNSFFGAIGVTHSLRNTNAVGGDYQETIVMVEFGMRGALLARQHGAELRDTGFGER